MSELVLYFLGFIQGLIIGMMFGIIIWFNDCMKVRFR